MHKNKQTVTSTSIQGNSSLSILHSVNLNVFTSVSPFLSLSQTHAQFLYNNHTFTNIKKQRYRDLFIQIWFTFPLSHEVSHVVKCLLIYALYCILLFWLFKYCQRTIFWLHDIITKLILQAKWHIKEGQSYNIAEVMGPIFIIIICTTLFHAWSNDDNQQH